MTLGCSPEQKERVGFFTDTSICIGSKACEGACKEWNLVPEDGLLWTGEFYDKTSDLGANSWRHVAFIEQEKPLRVPMSHVRSGHVGVRPRSCPNRRCSRRTFGIKPGFGRFGT